MSHKLQETNTVHKSRSVMITGTDLEVIIQSEVSQTKANIMCHLYAESKKWILIYKTEIDKTNL